MHRDELGVVPAEVVLALGDAVSRSSVEDLGLFGVVTLRRVYSGPTLGLVVPLRLAALPFLYYVFVAGVWEVELLVAGGSGRLYRASQEDEVDVHCQVVDCRRNIGIRKWAGCQRCVIIGTLLCFNCIGS